MSQIGRMRSRVDILEVEQGQPDGLGGFSTSLVVAATVWAQVEEQDGGRVYESQRIKNTSPYEVTLRAGSYVVTTNNLLRYNGLELTIDSVRRDQENRYTICQCTADG